MFLIVIVILFQGICEKTVQDIVERFWDIIEDITINKVMDGIKSNLVGVIVQPFFLM